MLKKFFLSKNFQNKFLRNNNKKKTLKILKEVLNVNSQTIKSLSKNKIPYREFKIKKTDEETLGNLFSYFILETIIIGKLTNINPFDQPAVEEVKLFTKKLLS